MRVKFGSVKFSAKIFIFVNGRGVEGLPFRKLGLPFRKIKQ